MEQERGHAMGERQNKLNAVREEVANSLEEEKEAIRAQTEEARATLAKDSRQMAADIGAHILHRPVSETTVSSVN
jgi:hypothetical protein